MEANEGLELLTRLCYGKDWFHHAAFDEFDRLVVYVKTLNLDVYHDVPDKIAGRQVLVHFASSKEARRDQYAILEKKSFFTENVIDITEEVELLDEPLDITELTKELDRLEHICGSNIMQDIFYEVHDQSNAVTNLSVKFPEVRSSMESLYATYGFDLIYDEMDG